MGDFDTIEESPQPEVEPETPAPASPPSIPSFVRWRERQAEDNVLGSPIGSAVKEWFDAQPAEEQERIGLDVDVLNSVWDRMEAALPPRPAPYQEPPQPPPPQAYRAPGWKQAQFAREAGRSSSRLDAAFTIGPSTRQEDIPVEKIAAVTHQRELNRIRARIKSEPGKLDHELDLAHHLFPKGLGDG